MNALTPIRAAVDMTEVARAASMLNHAAICAEATKHLDRESCARWASRAEGNLHEVAAAFGYTLTKEAAG